MNQHHLNILNLIQQNEGLTVEQKMAIVKSLKDADKELEITAFKLDRTEKVKRTTAILLEETIEELEQKRKAVEAQNRELEIEAALEKVRSRTMGMQKSDELSETAVLLFHQLKSLGLDLKGCGFNIWEKDEKICTSWMNGPDGELNPPFRLPLTEDPFFTRYYESRQNGEDFWVYETSEDELAARYQYLRTLPVLGELLAKDSKDGSEIDAISPVVDHVVNFSNGNLIFVTYKAHPEAWDIFKRFGKVFEQTYTRFLDLQKAESQARESQIQLAMERVRARTMAMQHSDELPDAANLLFQQVQSLGMPTWSAGYCIWQEDKNAITAWMSSEGVIQPPFRVPLTEEATFIHMKDGWEKGETLYIDEVSGEVCKAHYEYMRTLPSVGKILDSIIEAGHPLPTFQIMHMAYFSQGFLLFITYEPVTYAHDIFKRFAKVFEQTYTRFLDLQKAEAQAREAEIELALERIRARTMAMQKSEELGEISFELFKQVQSLGIATWHCAFNIYDTDQNSSTEWGTNVGGIYPTYKTPRVGIFLKYYEIGKSGETLHIEVIGEDKSAAHYAWLCSLPGVGEELLKLKNTGISFPTSQIDHVAYFKYGYLLFISYEPAPEAHEIFKRFAKVFEQTYTRFLDLQKAEAQAREAQIEAALERVRSRTMGMQKSEELKEIIQVVYDQFINLNIIIEHTGFILDYKARNDMYIWLTDRHAVPNQVTIPYFDSPHWNSFIDAKAKGQDFFANHLSFDEKNQFYRQLFKFIPGISNEVKEYYFNCAGVAISTVLLDNVGLYIENFSAIPYTEEENNTLMRFGKVFQQTYTRFLDLQKAEAQAIEAKIEASLERVRSKAMAMHNSQDLADTIGVFYRELHSFSITPRRCGVGLLNKEERIGELFTWNTTEQGESLELVGRLKMEGHPVLNKVYESWIEQTEYHPILRGTEIAEYYKVIRPQIHFPVYKHDDVQFGYFFFFKEGGVYAWTEKEMKEDELQIYRRFTSVLSLTYKRYRDLQQAEGNAKESQIQLALERVRARTMAMQKSAELADAAVVLFQQFAALGEVPDRISIGLVDKQTDTTDVWATDQAGTQINIRFKARNDERTTIEKMLKAWQAGEKSIIIDLQGDDLKNWIIYLRTELGMSINDENFHGRRLHNISFFSQGWLNITTMEPLPAETLTLLDRFAAVFNLTYTRFLDLKNAESQTRQAQIETAMEKVRSRALAMQIPEELVEVAQVLRKEMGLLGVEELETSSIYIRDELSGKTECWYAIKQNQGSASKLLSDHFILNLKDTWVGRQMDAFYLSDEKQISIPMQGYNRKEWIEYCTKQSNVFDGFYGENIPDRTYHLNKFSNGYIGAASPGEISPESWELLQRATSVFSLAYTRFSDLQQAEAQAREAKIEASLERMRAVAMSIRKSEELILVAESLYKELRVLEFTNIRNAQVVIKIEGDDLYLVCISSGDTSEILREHRYDTSPIIQKLYDELDTSRDALYQKEISGKDFEEWLNWRRSTTANIDEKLLEAGSVCFYLYSIGEGHLGISTYNAIENDQLEVLKRFRNVFELSYRRFMDIAKSEEQALTLKQEKERLEQTLADLQAAQKQLIQSEKMASLGELTAGIAHEIQNPLNFVNNFSEVSSELLDEMIAELRNSNPVDAIVIAGDLKQNLEKILHHGRRADGIVKGMLQHSRTSSGVKEPTNINILADEYLRLAYHGLRAKDKSFNAILKTDYDETIGSIEIIPQDIGRVILNLITNAFYAVEEKRKNSEEAYKPTVSVTTKSNVDTVEVSVKDNGIGISQKVMDKIFQPFFTTKPTGQGTGLGLSLSYDIIKAHGGELKVETGEGVGSEFIICLPV